MKTFSRLVLVSLVGIVVSLTYAACGCESGAVCISGDGNLVGPGSIPSPTVTPCPPGTPCATPTPDPCEVKSMVAGFHSGAQLPFIALGALEQLDATAYNDGGEVAKGCNVSRTPTWTVLTPTTCIVIGSGWNPYLRALRVGSCSLTASIVWDNRTVPSGVFTVEVQ